MVAGVLVTACMQVGGLPGGWSGTYLTRDEDDTMSFTTEQSDGAPTIRVAAAATNRGTNSRLVFGVDDAPPTTDHGLCVTASTTRWSLQEGVAVRERSLAGRHQAITVTKNVFAGATNYYHVHLWDSSTPGVARQIGSFDMADALGGPGAVTSGARRLCVRVAGARLTFKVWEPEQIEPDWTDAVHVRSLDVPKDWVHSGRASLYVGHVAGEHRVTFSDVATPALR